MVETNYGEMNYVFLVNNFPSQNYFHIKKGNGQVDSENIIGSKVERKHMFCQLGFEQNWSLTYIHCLIISKSMSVPPENDG